MTCEIVNIDGLPITKDSNGMHRSSVAELVAEIERLRGKDAEPAAWRAEDGRLIKHELKMTLTPRSAVEAFTEPLYPSPAGSSALRWAVGQLLDELPARRDWLNPDVERVLRVETGKPEGRKR